MNTAIWAICKPLPRVFCYFLTISIFSIQMFFFRSVQVRRIVVAARFQLFQRLIRIRSASSYFAHSMNRIFRKQFLFAVATAQHCCSRMAVRAVLFVQILCLSVWFWFYSVSLLSVFFLLFSRCLFAVLVGWCVFFLPSFVLFIILYFGMFCCLRQCISSYSVCFFALL